MLILQTLTRSEPIYYVTSGPMYGALRKLDDVSQVSRKSRDASRRRDREDRKRKSQLPKYVSAAVLNFTHDDVANGHVIYYPLSPSTGSAATLEDAFTFVLTARNVQPVADSVTVKVVQTGNSMMATSSVVTSSSTAVPDVAESASTPEDAGADKILIVVIVAILILLAIVGLVVFTCVRSRRATRRRKLELAAAIDGSGTAPMASASPDQPGFGDSGSDDGRGAARPPAAARRGAPLPPSLPVIVEPSSTDSGGDRSPTASTAAAVVIPNSPPPRSDSSASRTGYVRVLPPSPPTSPAGLQRNGAPPGDGHHSGPRSVWKEQVTFDWEHVDPELLQHCRKTNPVLHKNQYWV